MFSRILYPRFFFSKFCLKLLTGCKRYFFVEFILHILFFFLRILKLLLPCRKENTSNFLKKFVDTGFVKIYGEHVNDANKHFISNVFSIIKSWWCQVAWLSDGSIARHHLWIGDTLLVLCVKIPVIVETVQVWIF